MGVTLPAMIGDQWDVIVVGGGAAGLTAARAARARGAAHVALIERDRLGGECTHVGCIPSKTLIHAAGLAQSAREHPEVLAPPAVDFPAVMTRVRAVVSAIAEDESAAVLDAEGITVLTGEARFTDSHDIDVGGVGHRFRRAVIATGSSPVVPGFLADGSVPVLTNETVFDLRARPEHLVVVGGGPIGVELGQAFSRLGSAVTIVEQDARLLPALDEDAAAALSRRLTIEGVALRTGRTVTGTRGRRTIDLDDGSSLDADAVLVAVGRRPRVEGFGLERAGVEATASGITVDDRMRTGASHIFAAGDVTPGGGFTHVAAHQGRVAGENAAGRRARVDLRVSPAITFSDPEVASVGLSPERARERHAGVEVVDFPMAGVDRARTRGRTDGFVRIVTARRRLLGRLGGGKVVGGTVVGDGAGEMIHEIALAMQTGMFAGRLAQTIHAYPSASMAVQQAAGQLFPLGRALSPIPGDHALTRGPRDGPPDGG